VCFSKLITFPTNTSVQFLGAALSKARVYGSSAAGIAGSKPVEDMDVSSECCVLSGTGLCVGLITRLEESYRL